MKKRFARSPWALLAVLFAAAVVGCADDPKETTPPIETQPDPPLRALVDKKLFGEMPLDNGFFDPQFSTIGDHAWLCLRSDFSNYAEATRVFQETPTGQPAMFINRGTTALADVVLGLAFGGPGPHEASVWLGSSTESGFANRADATISLIGLFGNGTGGVERTVQLQEDPTSAPLFLGGVLWRRYIVPLDDGPYGMAYLFVQVGGTVDAYLTGPTLVATPSTALAARLRPEVAYRPINDLERRAIGMASRIRRDSSAAAQRSK